MSVLYIGNNKLNAINIISYYGRELCAMVFLLFLFIFFSLVVRSAELDGGCMRLARDHE